MSHESEPTSDTQFEGSGQQPLQGSVLEQIMFRGKKAILGGDFRLEDTAIRVEVVEDPDTILFVLRNKAGEEIALRLDEPSRKLIGDYRDYPLSNDQVEALKRLADRR